MTSITSNQSWDMLNHSKKSHQAQQGQHARAKQEDNSRPHGHDGAGTPHDHAHCCGHDHVDAASHGNASPHGHGHVDAPGKGVKQAQGSAHQHGPGCSHDHGHDHHHGHSHGHTHDQDAHGAHQDDCCQPSVSVASPPPCPAFAGGLLLRIPAMDCPVEEGQIRRALEGFTEVKRLHFDLAGRTLSIDAPRSAWDSIDAAIKSAGFSAQRLTAPPTAEQTAKAQRKEFVRMVAALGVAVLAEGMHFFAPETLPWQISGMAVAALAIGLSGVGVFAKGLAALVRGQLNINALMSVAVTGAFCIGQWPEAAMVMALYSLAELIEARSVERARNTISGLLALSPPQAEILQSDGRWLAVDARLVRVGTVARVKPGERFALDGRVVAGQGAVDQSSVTGESIPVDKQVGDLVFAGSINLNGALEFEITKLVGDTVLAQIIHAVEAAQAQRAPTQRFVDRFAAVYTPSIFVLALAVAIGMPLLLDWPWLTAVYKALVLLVIACPCALVISTPVTVVSGLTAAARRGILIKGGVYLEQARKLTVVAFDKTGTLTEGKPQLIESVILSALPAARILSIARSISARSDHPVACAIAAGLKGDIQEVDRFGAEPGMGVQGTLGGRSYVLGNLRLIRNRGTVDSAIEAAMLAHESQGRTVSILADGERVLALFAVADTLKSTSRQAIADMKALGVRPVMLTGDNQATAQAVALQLGIVDVRANLLPKDKHDLVVELGSQGVVGMVGDGVNDSPSLAAASIGFSMGAAGTDTAKEAADVLVMNDDLRRIPETIRLSKRTHSVLWQNIAMALAIKAAFFGMAVAGNASMWMAVFADMGASLLVVFNGLRLLREGRPRE